MNMELLTDSKLSHPQPSRALLLDLAPRLATSPWQRTMLAIPFVNLSAPNCYTWPKDHLTEHGEQLRHTLTLARGTLPKLTTLAYIVWVAHSGAPQGEAHCQSLSILIVAPKQLERSTKASHTGCLTIGAPFPPTLPMPPNMANTLQWRFTLKSSGH